MRDILELAEAGDTTAVFRDIRVRSLMWPYYFEKVCLQCDKMVDHLHGKELELFTENFLNGHRKQWIEWPRGHFKTTCFTTGFAMWLVLPHTEEDEKYAVDVLEIPVERWRRRMTLHNQDYCILLAFENVTNAKRKVYEIKRAFEANELFRACFPEIAAQGNENPWSTEALTIRRTEKGLRIGEATFQAIGVQGAVQSQHYDVIIEDDIVGKEATESKIVMDSTIIWHGQLNGAMNGPNLGMGTLRIGVSNRWGFNDLNSKVRAEEPDFLFHKRSVVEFDEETREERPIFPEQFTLATIENIRTSAGMSKYDYACQYQNTPIPPGDNEVSDAKLHKYHVEEDGKIVCDTCGFSTYPTHLRRYMHYDPYNAKGIRSLSAPAIGVIGLSTDKHVLLLDYFVSKGDYGKIYDQLIEYNDQWWPEVMTYEDVGAQNMCEFYLKQIQKSIEFKEAKHKHFRRILAVGTRGRAKEIRIRDSLFPVIENGKFAIREKHQTFKNMLATWPHVVPDHDYDLLDALAQGPSIWQFPYTEEYEKQIKVDEAEILAALGRPFGHTGVRVQ